ncbi:aldo/keto reductase [Alloscardovia theropitheci]|uniref:Aldo/keto reductase n=2 Tax=Alloscardovia theropitheci TaxID=2496842 RepID=A0A4R0QZF9_9BIFI|nr:aldo/keto reductase [Alloscardovia theropitheci]
MKKIITSAIALLAAFTLVACNTTTQTNSSASNTTVSQEVPDSQKPSAVSDIKSVADVPLLTLNNETQMPQLGLGTQIQSLESDSSQAGRQRLNNTSRESVIAALKAGYRHLDTAHGYYNETGVGEGIKESGVPRNEIWLTSKLWPSDYANAAQAIDDMLKRLQVDYIDLLYLHHPTGDYMAAYRAVENAVREGKVRAIGISNFDNNMNAFNDVMNNATIKPQALQIEMHPLAQRTQTRELAKKNNLQVEAWYPLGHADSTLLNNSTLASIARSHNKTVPQVILRWLMQEGVSAVPGSNNPDHIRENLNIFDFELSDSEMNQIRGLDQGESGRYFNINYDQMGQAFMRLNE